MEGIFAEFENENALRSYPFAEGCVPGDNDIPAGVFVDAAIYPVNPSGTVHLSSISEDGVFGISDDTGVIMEGVASGRTVEFTDNSGLGRHVGTLVASSAEALAEFAGRGSLREFSSDNAAFSSACVFPVVVDGVTSVSIGESGKTSGAVGFLDEREFAADDIHRKRNLFHRFGKLDKFDGGNFAKLSLVFSRVKANVDNRTGPLLVLAEVDVIIMPFVLHKSGAAGLILREFLAVVGAEEHLYNVVL